MTGHSEIERFAKETGTNESFRNELKAVGADSQAIVRFANEKGFDFSAADVDSLTSSAELSDEQLENVAGGRAADIMCVGSPQGYVCVTKGRLFVWF
jgi:predicted ribosomally synthesized peptide with nif11-like leader